jgi:hypothetical protein
MTHFTVAIIIPPNLDEDVTDFAYQQMQPYDESLTVPPYVCYSMDKAEREIAAEIERYTRIIAAKDPAYRLDKCQEHLEELKTSTPQQRYQERLKFFEQFNPQGEPLSRSNPDAKWDWYVIGGRWDGWILDRDTSGERAEDNLATAEHAVANRKVTHAIITPDGVWHEHGQMGWWGILLTENAGWDDQALALLASYPGHNILIIDAHI